jgi:hypothetical protein
VKPLYLGGGEHLAVRLDGPALLVQGAGRCAGRYPLDRLSRVVCGTEVGWDTLALIECLVRGIVVTFTDRRGRVAGLCFGPRRREPTLAQSLAAFLDRPDWEERYDLWRTAQERREILRALGALRLRQEDLRATQVRARLFNHLTRAGWARPGTAFERLEGYLETCVAERLFERIGDADVLCRPRVGFDLTWDCTLLVAWRLYRPMFAAAKNLGQAATPLQLMALVESHWRELQGGAEETVASLERWLRDLGY